MEVFVSDKTINNQDWGILVRSELSATGMESFRFVKAACSQQGLLPLPHITIKWHNPDQYQNQDQYPKDGMPFGCCKYTWLQPQKYNLTLLNVPSALRGDFQPDDLQFPFRLAGCVLIVNLQKAFTLKAAIANQGDWPSLETQFEFQKIWAGDISRPQDLQSDEWITNRFRNNLNDVRTGGIAWVRLYKLPFVVVPVWPMTSVMPLPIVSLDEMVDLFDLEPHIPVISCPLKYSKEDIRNLNFPFSREDIEQVLLALVEHIEAENLP